MTTQVPPPKSGIQIVGATKSYSHTARPAVDDISLDIADGEFMTFLGPSGSGKTTTLSMIAGFTTLTSGRILIDGQDISGQKPHRRNLGVVFQQYALFPHLTVRQNVAYPLQQRKVSKSEIGRRVDEALEMVSLTEYGDRLPKQLSGGQQQRVALARAVVYEPGALLLDEPLGALDKKLRDSLQRQIARMHKELGMTFIFVTHDQEEALTLSDRIAVFNEGRIEQVGTPTELYDHPETLFVAEFLGESNVFRGTLNEQRMLECASVTYQCSAEEVDGLAAEAAIVVRPERLELIAAAETAPAGRLAARAAVTDVRYVGSHHRIGLDYGDGGKGSAMQLVGTHSVPTPGDEVLACWTPDHHSLVSVPPEPAGNAAGPNPPTVVLSLARRGR